MPAIWSRRGSRPIPHALSAAAAPAPGSVLDTGSIAGSIGALGSGRTGGGVSGPAGESAVDGDASESDDGLTDRVVTVGEARSTGSAVGSPVGGTKPEQAAQAATATKIAAIRMIPATIPSSSCKDAAG
jgi:hypothetical protein